MKWPQSHHLEVTAVKGDAAVPALTYLLDEILIVVPRDVEDDDALFGWNAVKKIRRRWRFSFSDGNDRGSLYRGYPNELQVAVDDDRGDLRRE